MQRSLGLVLAGGGNRAFWQLGLLEAAGDLVWPRVAALAACSAGAAVAVVALSGRSESAHRFWLGRRAHVTRNFEWARVLRGERPTPHAPIYRDTVLHALAEGGLERLRALPFPLLVMSARPPGGLSTPSALLLGLAAYNVEKRLHPGRVHPRYGRRLGFEPHVFDLRTAPDADTVADVVLASSATPPFTPVGRVQGERLLDGGLVDNVPVFVAEAVPGVERSLVLLTRPYPAITPEPGAPPRTYLGPRVPVPIDRWDYTRPELLAATIDQGRREGAAARDVVERAVRG